MSIINSKKSVVIFLESTSSFWNQKTLYFSDELVKKGWKEKNIRHITKKGHHKRRLLKITLINSQLMRDLMRLETLKEKQGPFMDHS